MSVSSYVPSSTADTLSCFADLVPKWRSFNEVEDSELSPLLQMARKGNVVALRSLLEKTKFDQPQEISCSALHTAICVAAKYGHVDFVNYLIKAGLSLKPCIPIGDKPPKEARLTPMGHAIENRQESVVVALLKQQMAITDILYDERLSCETALDLYFSQPDRSLALNLLRSIVSKTNVSRARPLTFFNIATLATHEELLLLLEAGLDPNIVVEGGRNLPKIQGGQRTIYVKPPITLFDLAVMRANRDCVDFQAIENVKALLDKKPNLFEEGKPRHPYLHLISDPSLAELFVQAGVPVTFAHSVWWPLLDTRAPLTPRQIAYEEGYIRKLEELERGLPTNPSTCNQLSASKDPVDEAIAEDARVTLKFIHSIRDLKAVNHHEAVSWKTSLHSLFSAIADVDCFSFVDMYAFVNCYSNIIYAIKMCIHFNALPSVDTFNRTPLMSLHYGADSNGGLSEPLFYEIIKLFTEYEAAYYDIDPNLYEKALLDYYKQKKILFSAVESISDVTVKTETICNINMIVANAFWGALGLMLPNTFLDSFNRTPLMRLLSDSCAFLSEPLCWQVIESFSRYEAMYYGIDPNQYQSELLCYFKKTKHYLTRIDGLQDAEKKTTLTDKMNQTFPLVFWGTLKVKEAERETQEAELLAKRPSSPLPSAS